MSTTDKGMKPRSKTSRRLALLLVLIGLVGTLAYLARGPSDSEMINRVQAPIAAYPGTNLQNQAPLRKEDRWLHQRITLASTQPVDSKGLHEFYTHYIYDRAGGLYGSESHPGGGGWQSTLTCPEGIIIIQDQPSYSEPLRQTIVQVDFDFYFNGRFPLEDDSHVMGTFISRILKRLGIK